MQPLYSQSRGADNVYVNVVMYGPETAGPIFATEATYDVTRDQAIIQNPSDYYASIIRMTIPLDDIPLLIMPIIPNQKPGSNNTGVNLLLPPGIVPAGGYPNATPFVLGIVYNGVNYPRPAFGGTQVYGGALVQWQPEEVSINTPPPVQNQLAQVITRYYYMFSYATIVSMLNVALAAAFADFILANPGAPQAAFGPPFIIYDAVAQLLSFVWHSSWITPPPATTPPPLNIPRVSANAPFDGFINGFRDLIVHDENIADTNNVNYVFENTGDNGYPTNTFPAVPTYLSTRQTYNSIALLASLRSIVVTTNLPIVAEAIPLGFAGSGGQGGGSATLPILSDFIVQLTLSSDVRSVAYYTPTAQYRLVDMQSNVPLRRITMSVFWQDKDNGELFPIFLTQTQQANLKLGFFKKSMYQKSLMPQ